MKLNLELTCPKCHSNKYYYNKSTYPISPPSFEHICFECGKISNSSDYNTFNKLPIIMCMNNDEILKELNENYNMNFEISSNPQIVTNNWIKVLKIIDIEQDITEHNLFDILDKLNQKNRIVMVSLRYTSHSPMYASMLATLRKYFCL